MNRTWNSVVVRVLASTLAVLVLGGYPRFGHASGGGIGGFADATEIPQLANNSELLTTVGLQAQQIAQAVQQTLTQAGSQVRYIQEVQGV
jgi:hypothetical protein